MASKRLMFFPYAFADEGLALQITGLELDGQFREGLVNSSTYSVALPADEAWRKGRLLLRLALQDERKLVPEQEVASPPWKAMITVSCDKTRWRRGFSLKSVGGDGASWAGELPLEHDHLRGAVRLNAFLVRTTGLATPEYPYADARATRLASAPEWQIHVDSPPLPPGHYLEIKWENFQNSDHAVRKAKAQSLVYFLDLDEKLPIIWLNEGIPDLKPVLDSKGTVGDKAQTRNVLFDSIAQSVWTALVLQSAQVVAPDQTEPPEDWQKAVLQRFAPLIHDNLDPELAVEQLVREVRDPTRIGTLMARLLPAVQTYLNVVKSTTGILHMLED